MRTATILLGVSVIAVTSTGCVAVGVESISLRSAGIYHGGPPPHAPAHGYRHKHPMGMELRFDTNLDVYVVVGRTNRYYQDGLFVRLDSGVWQVSAELDGPWEHRTESWIPSGLRKRHQAKKAKHPGRGHGPAKPAW